MCTGLPFTWKQRIEKILGNAAYIRPKMDEPFPEPCASRSCEHRAALYLETTYCRNAKKDYVHKTQSGRTLTRPYLSESYVHRAAHKNSCSKINLNWCLNDNNLRKKGVVC
jgi:hypothetical protein